MFNKDFYPTPDNIIKLMLEGETIKDKTILEPSAGKGNIIDVLNQMEAKSVLFCEIEKDLQTICTDKAKLLKEDFMSVKTSDISHIDLIVMNPPFSKDLEHILHAFEVAPDGCKIITLCNSQTIENTFSNKRKELKTLVDSFGSYENIGDCFTDAERKTAVKVGLIKIEKPADKYETEFTGFFMEDEEEQENGLLSYNAIRDLVGRYVMAVKIFDQQEQLYSNMVDACGGFFAPDLGFSARDRKGNIVDRDTFKKELQRDGWKYIFRLMNLGKYATSGLRDDINKFIEEQTEVPFTMKNIFVMLDVILQTTGQRMNKALEEVFEKLTQHHKENRYNVKGWKTNSHYMLNEKFIFPYMVEPRFSDRNKVTYKINSYFDRVEDFLKALCYITGDNYDDFNPLKWTIQDGNFDFGQWYDWAYFEIKCFKKGTIHFKFKDREIWARFNQKIAEIKGFPLFESNEQTRAKNAKKQERETARQPKQEVKKEPVILGTFKV